ncbi:MAG: ABC transporter permease [Acidimicrobiales bacterium]
MRVAPGRLSEDSDLVPVEPAARPLTRRRSVGLTVAGAWLAVVAVIVVFAPWLWFVDDPDAFSTDVNLGASGTHWFGTDELGRDMFARVVWGGRVSLQIAGVSVAVGMVFGTLLGLAGGFFRGWIDTVVSALINAMLALPTLVLALFIITVLEQSQRNVTIAVIVLAVPAIARVVRAQTLRWVDREFVLAARTMGASTPRILFREIFPNVVPALVSFTFLALSVVLVAEGSLSFLGKSVPAPEITWGGILAQGRSRLEESPHIAIWVSVVLFATLLALNYVGDTLLKRFDVRNVE